VIGKSLFRREAGESDVNAGFLRVAFRIQQPCFAEPGHGWVEQDHIDVMMVLRCSGGKLS